MKKTTIAVMVLCLLIFASGCNVNKANQSIAEVNGEIITKQDFDAFYAVLKADYEIAQGVQLDENNDQEIVKQIKNNTYENLVVQKLIHQDAAKQDIKVDAQEVEEFMDYIVKAKDAQESDGFKKFLAESKFTEAGLREYLETQQLNSLLAEKVTADIKVDETEIRQQYDDNMSTYLEPEGIQIYHILVEEEAVAQDIIALLDDGGDFAALAAQYSIDVSNKDQGGDLGIVNQDTQFVAEFKAAALDLQPFTYTSEPVKSQYGFHIIKAGERQAARQLPYDEVKDEIAYQLENEKKDQSYQEYIADLKANADIKDLR